MATTHRLSRMTGRSEDESHRTATPLELFFDLSFVLAFSAASAQFSHAVAADHLSSGLVGFVFSMFAIVWAWINFTWFASAYDTDDWLFRVTTMVQMVGVLVLAIGIPPLFASLEHGEHLDNGLMVAGYVIMRLAMVFQWLRAAKQDPARRSACLAYAKAIALAQVGWVVLIAVHTTPWQTFVLMLPLYVVELGGPLFAERRRGGTPWHAHHVAERHGLLAIIALGECLLGTIAALSVLVEEQHGLSVDVVVLGLAGTGLAFTMWWLYFTLPSADVLHRRRRLGFRWGYGHIAVFMAIAATGAGLHVAAYYLEGESTLGPVGVVLATAVPVAVFGLCLAALYALLVGLDQAALRNGLAALVLLTLAVVLAASGVGVPWCLLVVMLAPVPAIVSDERVVARRREQALARLLDD
ncbi:low temperature requirement protein A [Pedococcus sp. P5_B7]